MRVKKIKTLKDFTEASTKSGGVERYLDRLQDMNYELGKMNGRVLDAGKVALFTVGGVAAFEIARYLAERRNK